MNIEKRGNNTVYVLSEKEYLQLKQMLIFVEDKLAQMEGKQ